MGYEQIQAHCCTDCNTNSSRVMKEKKCQYRVENPDGHLLCLTRIDGCHIQGNVMTDLPHPEPWGRMNFMGLSIAARSRGVVDDNGHAFRP